VLPGELDDEDRATLVRWTARRKTAQSLVLRSRIILRCPSGLSNMALAHELGTTDQTVCKWRGRIIMRGVAGCWMNRAAGYRARSPMSRLRPCLSKRWSHPARCDALEHPLDCRGERLEPSERRTHLGRLRVADTSH